MSEKVDNDQSRAAQMSGALHQLSKDWKEQHDALPISRPRKFLLFFYLTPLLYVLSAGPVGALLKATVPTEVGKMIWTCLYYPLFFWIQHQLPLARILRAYLGLWT